MVRQSPELGLMAAMIRQSITDAAGDDPVARAEALNWLGSLSPDVLARIASGVAGHALQNWKATCSPAPFFKVKLHVWLLH